MKIEIGDFITIPAWAVTGQVIAIEDAYMGTEASQRVLVQDKPGARGQWYHLEPSEFTFDGDYANAEGK